MEVVHPQVAGIDVHKKVIWVAVRLPGQEHGQRAVTVRRFKAFWRSLQKMAGWLAELGVADAAMESTGVYWWPVYHALAQAGIEVCVCNAAHMRNVPGRKSDMKDARWLADLLAMGLIRSSFVPPAPIQDLRDLTRTRKQLVREIARHTQRIQKTLEDANVKLTEAISDILGTSGRAILKALMTGETDPERLIDLTTGRLKASRAQLVEVLRGRVTAHHRFMITLHLTQIEALETAVTTIEARISDALAPFRAAVTLLTTMPGLSETAAAVTLAAIGEIGRAHV